MNPNTDTTSFEKKPSRPSEGARTPRATWSFRLKATALLIGLPIAAAGAYLLFAFNPATHTGFPPCLFHWLTGLYCPGCGSTRAMHQLLHLHFLAALRFNSLLVLSLPILGLACLGRGPVYRAFLQPVTPWLAAIILIAYWIARNIPYAPFSYLAPH